MIKNITMRDCLISAIHQRMRGDKNIFFLCADFGAPSLDGLRKEFPNRFLNVGIAEQNLVNISTGLALEGFSVYAYAIASFLTMRAFEQIRNNLALQAQLKKINVNLIGVGAGLSYGLSGPSHHCLEDLSIMRALPNIELFSPCDCPSVEKFLEYSLKTAKPKYLRLDSASLPPVYTRPEDIDLSKGFAELIQGKGICLVSTGYMTHKALRIAPQLACGVIDVFLLRPFNKAAFLKAVEKYDRLVTLEEGFINQGVLGRLADGGPPLLSLGFPDSYTFEPGKREYLHKLNGLDEETIIEKLRCGIN